MNSKGQVWAIIIFIGFLFLITSFVTIGPLKESLDEIRDAEDLNCLGVLDFNQTAFDSQTTFERFIYRPTCFVTGISMVWFIGAFGIAVVIWVVDNVRKSRRK